MDSLSDKHYEVKQIQEILDIDRNRLFYWTRTHGLLVPEVAQPDGTGRRARFSIKNLMELTFIKEMVRFGMDLRSVKLIKEQLDQTHKALGEKDIFKYALGTRIEECWLSIFRRENKKFVIQVGYIDDYGDVDGDEGGFYPIPAPAADFLYETNPPSRLAEFISIRVELGRLAEDLLSKLEGT